MDQSKSARGGETVTNIPTAPAKDIVDTTFAAGNFTLSPLASRRPD
jgi:hypothetical protein